MAIDLRGAHCVAVRGGEILWEVNVKKRWQLEFPSFTSSIGYMKNEREREVGYLKKTSSIQYNDTPPVIL